MEQKRFQIFAEDGPLMASSDTYDGAVTACLWLEQQDEPAGTPLAGGRFRIVDSAAAPAHFKFDREGVQLCRRCDWPKAHDQQWPSGYC